MSNTGKLRGIATAFLIEARSDSEAVRVLIENGQYSLAVYHAQQAVEKLLKACLAIEGIIGIYKHEIFHFFTETLKDRFADDEIQTLMETVPALEEEWSATRYPGWDDGHLWIPSQEYTLEDAKEMESKMKAAAVVLKKFLKAGHGIE